MIDEIEDLPPGFTGNAWIDSFVNGLAMFTSLLERFEITRFEEFDADEVEDMGPLPPEDEPESAEEVFHKYKHLVADLWEVRAYAYLLQKPIDSILSTSEPARRALTELTLAEEILCRPGTQMDVATGQEKYVYSVERDAARAIGAGRKEEAIEIILKAVKKAHDEGGSSLRRLVAELDWNKRKLAAEISEEQVAKSRALLLGADNIEASGCEEDPPANRPDQSVKARFDFRNGLVLFDGRDLELPSGQPLDVLKKLVTSFGSVVEYRTFDRHYSSAEPGALPKSVSRIRRAFREFGVPCEIKAKTGEGYVIRQIQDFQAGNKTR